MFLRQQKVGHSFTDGLLMVDWLPFGNQTTVHDGISLFIDDFPIYVPIKTSISMGFPHIFP